MPRVKTPTSAVATRLIDTAGQLLSAEGIAGLTLRRLAAEAQTTTMSVYTLFGDKDGLLAAMYREGFRRLGAAMAQTARGPNSLENLGRLGLTYRSAAHENPHLYTLMFGRPAAGFVPSDEDKVLAEATFAPLVSAVAECLEDGSLLAGPATRIAAYLWSVCHGFVSLELSGAMPGQPAEPDATYADTLFLAIIPFLPNRPFPPPLAGQ